MAYCHTVICFALFSSKVVEPHGKNSEKWKAMTSLSLYLSLSLAMIGCFIREIEWICCFLCLFVLFETETETETAMIKQNLEIEEFRYYFWIMIKWEHHDSQLSDATTFWSMRWATKTLINWTIKMQIELQCFIWWMAHRQYTQCILCACVHPFATHQM